MKTTVIVALIILVALAVAHFVLAAAFRAGVEAARQRLIASQNSAPPDQALIPEVIRDFAARSGARPGGPAVIRLVQSAEMRLQANQPFFHIDATQFSASRVPGFVWEARGHMAGFTPIEVVDAYVAGEGWLEARIAGSIRAAYATGSEADRGEAMRFLAELPWNPEASINAAGLSWQEIDGGSVQVSLQTTGGPASVRLGFDETGDVVTMQADDRPRSVGTQTLPTRWIGRFRDYANFGDYRLPRFGEVAWMLPEGEFVYWRGEIVSAAPVE